MVWRGKAKYSRSKTYVTGSNKIKVNVRKNFIIISFITYAGPFVLSLGLI